MTEFLRICFSFPTVVYTALLGVVCIYWLAVMASGGAALDLLDVDLQFGGATEAGAEGAGGLAHVFAAMGFNIVPFPIAASTCIFAGWVASFFGMLYLSGLVGGSIITASLAFLLSLGAAFVGGTVLMQPFRPLFRTFDDSGGDSMVGEVCEIRSSSVDGDSGRATYQDESTDATISVRCPEDNDLGRGSRALIIGYDESNNTYRVEPYDDVLGG